MNKTQTERNHNWIKQKLSPSKDEEQHTNHILNWYFSIT